MVFDCITTYIYPCKKTKYVLMNFFTRLSNGWTIAMNSLKVLKANKQLIIFPILSGFAMLLVSASFIVAVLAKADWQVDYITDDYSRATQYVLMFLFYFVNYFVIVFFNVALMHCTHLYFKGEEVSLQAGLRFSLSRLGAIVSWALFAATVGTLLRILQESLGKIGKIIIGLIGIVWNIATFFVVPVIAYENENAIGAFKRSVQLMKEKWGESIGASFSFGIIQFIAFLLLGALAFVIGSFVHIIAGVAVAVIGGILILATMSAAQSIFISAVYHNVTGNPVEHFHQNMIDELFIAK